MRAISWITSLVKQLGLFFVLSEITTAQVDPGKIAALAKIRETQSITSVSQKH